MRIRFAILLAMLISVPACRSPEASRARGGGPGADKGNHAPVVKMHEGSQQFWKTPVIVPGRSVSLEPAAQARELSRR